MMADTELTVVIGFDPIEVEPTEVDDAVTRAIEDLELIKSGQGHGDVTITMAYSLKYHGVVQR